MCKREPKMRPFLKILASPGWSGINLKYLMIWQLRIRHDIKESKEMKMMINSPKRDQKYRL